MLLSSVLVNLVLFLFYHLPLTESYNIVDKEGGKCSLSLWYEVDKCMPNREIHNYICHSSYSYRMDEYDGYGKWVRRKEKDRKCSVTNSKCLCERAVWDEFDNFHCRCVRALEYPDFPSIGILKWNEKVDFNLDEDSSWVRDVKTEHEIHRNGNGYYLRKYVDYNWNDENLPYEYKFEIYVPIENGKFKQITGKLEDKICKVHIVSNGGGKFDTLWLDKKLHSLSKNIQKNERISTQVWDRRYDGDMQNYQITWKLEYDSARGVAIPISHRYHWEDWFYEKYKRTNRDFSFIDLPKDKTSFEVTDYCKNDIGV